MKLLTVCIPTYKRPDTLRRCISSVVSQIQHSELQDQVAIYVTDDASPDNTDEVLQEFQGLEFFQGVTRKTNLGMSANIKRMLEDIMSQSSFQLIITDDDYLLDDALDAIIECLAATQRHSPGVSVLWTPRYSFTDDDQLQGIVCETFTGDRLILPSFRSAGRYMYNGFVLSGLIVKASEIDFDLWSEFLDNAYFPVIFSGEIMLRNPVKYWHRSIVHHSVLNECHWDRWGRSEAEITLRLFIDYLNAYVVVGGRLRSVWQKLVFYTLAFPRAFQMTNSLLITSGGFHQLGDSESMELLGLDKISHSRLQSPAGLLLFLMMIRVICGCLVRVPVHGLLSIIAPDRSQRKKRLESYQRLKQWLMNAKFVMRWAG